MNRNISRGKASRICTSYIWCTRATRIMSLLNQVRSCGNAVRQPSNDFCPIEPPCLPISDAKGYCKPLTAFTFLCLNISSSSMQACLTSVAASSSVVFCDCSFSITLITQTSVMSTSTLVELLPGRASAPEGQAWTSCCSDNNRICPIVASMRGRAKLGLQASSRLSK